MSEQSNTPDPTDDDGFSITHPFHPLVGHQFPLLAQRVAWGEPRVFFLDPTTQRVRSLPTAWTNLAPRDPFVQLSAGRALLRLVDLDAVIALLQQHVPSVLEADV